MRLKRGICLLSALLCLAACGRTAEPDATTQTTAAPLLLNADALLNEADVQHYDCAERGHVFSAATCRQAATCYYCGETQGEKGAHDFTHATCLQKSVCTVCGLERGELAAHIFSAASCAGPASCVVCGITSGSAGSHSFRPATCVSPSRCSVCMKTTGSALGHIWAGGSCTTPQVCTRCQRQIAAPGHKMTEGSCTQDAVCTVCGYTVKAPGHHFENGICTVCGQTRVEASRAESSRAVLTGTQTETQPLIDKTLPEQYAQTIETHLQTAHDQADASIGESVDTRAQTLSGAIDELKVVMETLDEADALCAADARFQPLQPSLTAIRKAIRESAAASSLNGDLIKKAISVRSDSTKALEALGQFRKALESL